MARNSIFTFLLGLLFWAPLKGQEVMNDTLVDPYADQAAGMVQTLEYYFNLLGAKRTSLTEKDIIINDSYLKLFANEKVQIEDDLQEGRSAVIYKDVQAYLKDIDFFFTEATFDFEIDSVMREMKADNTPYYKVELVRILNGVTISGDSVNTTKKRFVELNFDEKSEDLKIVSVYTKKVSKQKQIREWWNSLTLEWKSIFQDQIGVYFDSLSTAELFQVVTLDSLDLSGNDLIRDIEPIYQLTGLKYLKLSNTWVTDLRPLLSTNKLQSLDLSNSAIDDLKYLKYHSDIQSIDLSNSPVDTFTVLSAFDKLKTLKLNGAAFLDLSFVSELNGLEQLLLREAKGTNTIDFSQLQSLKQLDLLGSDILQLPSLSRLTELNISDTEISDLSFLSNANALVLLEINNIPVNNIDALLSCTKLERVYANGTTIDEVSLDKFVKESEALLITNTAQLESWWEGLSPSMRDAFSILLETRQPSPEQLTRLIRSEYLDLSNKRIIDLKPLERFRFLKALRLDKNPISQLPREAISYDLEALYINDTRISDISALYGHPKLKTLEARNTLISDISVLVGQEQLTLVDVDNTNVEPDEVNRFLDQTENIKVRFITGELESWWNALKEPLRNQLLSNISAEGNVNADVLHELVATKTLKFENEPFTRQASTAVNQFYRLEELVIKRGGLPGLQLLPVVEGLKSLEISEMPISDLTGLPERYPLLEKLSLVNTAVDDLRPIQTLTELRYLNFSGTNVRRMRGLEFMSELVEIDCSNTRVFRLNRLEGLENLKRLTCFNTGLKQNDIDGLKEYLPDLKVIYY